MFERIQHLSAAMAAGNTDAVDAFYRRYFDWMYQQARRVTRRDESFCLDVVQDAVLRVMRTVKAVDCENRFRGWLRLVVQTTAFDLLRREVRRKNREAMAGTSQLEVGTDSLQLDWLREQIAALDPEIVNIIELRFTQSWTLSRIGENLGISIGAVDGRLRRALKNLKLAAEDPPMVLAESKNVGIPAIESPVVNTETIVAAIPEPVAAEVADTRDEESAIVEPVVLEPVMVEKASDVEIAHITQPPELVELSAMAVAIEPVDVDAAAEPVNLKSLELISLEDEAGAYDDRL
jgi:RNA polymerase sigma factor (sigma-70 family)